MQVCRRGGVGVRAMSGCVDAIFLFTFKLAIRLSVAFVFDERFLLPFFGCLRCDNFATCLACNGSEQRYVGANSLAWPRDELTYIELKIPL